MDDAKFVFQSFTYFGVSCTLPVTPLQAFFTQMAQVTLSNKTVRYWKNR